MPSPRAVFVGRSFQEDMGQPSNQGGSPGKGGPGSGSSNQGSSCAQSNQFNSGNDTILDDNSATVVYFGDWKLITGNTSGNGTQHVTSASNASVYAPFSGTSITVVGTVPNGTDPIIANYSIDGGAAQTRIVPTSSQCQIPKEPFFSITGLKDGTHHINISMVQVGNRPYMFNFFALDPSSSDHHQKKSNAGKIAGGVIGGLILLALVCGISFFVWRKRRLSNVYAQNRAHDARMQQWMGPQDRDMFNRDLQKQSVLLGSSEGGFMDSTPAIPVNLGQRQYGAGSSRIFGRSTPSWITTSSRMRFSENPALPPSNVPPNGTGANGNAMASHFSPNTSMAFSPPAGKWDEIPVNDARAREMSQITEDQVTAAIRTNSLNALASHFSPNTSVALSTPAYKWDQGFLSLKEAAAAGTRDGRARGRTPSIIVEDEPKRVSTGPTLHSVVSGSEVEQGQAL